MGYREHEVTARDGRTLEVGTTGDAAGVTAVFHHGSPSSALVARTFDGVAESAGLYVVSVSRPGYGSSSRQAGRTISSVVEDVHTVLDALGRDTYVSAGWSGGGPHSLACAALGAPRCRAAWSLAGVAPMVVDFDWTAGMGPENVREFTLAAEGGPAYEAAMLEDARRWREVTSDTIVELFGGLLSEVDAAAMADDADRQLMVEESRRAFATSHWGYYDDDRAFFSAWGFDVADIAVPVSIWYGDQDLMVPPTHGAWLGAHVPGARVVHRPAEGHLSLVLGHVDEIARDLAAAGRA
jgi:pimeloyl-ACP methyl ester carboxylesterase